MAENQNDEQQNALVDSLRALSGGQGGPLESALGEFLNGEGRLAEATRAASTQGGKEIAALVKFLVDQFNLSPSMATIIATLLIKIAPSLAQKTPKKRKKPAAKPKKKTTAAKKPVAKKKPAAKRSTEKKKPATKPKKKSAAKKKPSSTAKKRKPANKNTRTTVIREPGEIV